MSINNSNFKDGVVIHKNEWILLYGEKVKIEFSGNDNSIFAQRKTGNIFLTTHRLIFQNSNATDSLKLFSMPLWSLGNISIESYLLDLYVICGSVSAEQKEIWSGIVNFKIYFESAEDTLEFGNSIKKIIDLIKEKPEQSLHPLNNLQKDPDDTHQFTARMHMFVSDELNWLPKKFIEPPPPNIVFLIGESIPYPGVYSVPLGCCAPQSTPKTNSYHRVFEENSSLIPFQTHSISPQREEYNDLLGTCTGKTSKKLTENRRQKKKKNQKAIRTCSENIKIEHNSDNDGKGNNNNTTQI